MLILAEALATMESAAIQAGNTVYGFRQESRRLASRKDFLTDADLKSEEIVLHVLAQTYPDIPAYSEEQGGTPVTAGYQWIIDPIDGTINFFLGDDHFAVSIALTLDGKTVAGVVYAPAKHQLFAASSNVQSYIRTPEGSAAVSITVSRESQLPDSQIWVGWGKEEHAGDDHKKVYDIIARLDRHSLYPQMRNSAATEMALVAYGRIMGYVFSKPEPFDIAAAGLIVTQAGGTVTDMQGQPWSPFSLSIMASNGIIHDKLLEILS